jgi:hypothetical protein
MKTGKCLVDHWHWAAENGVMDRNAAAGRWVSWRLYAATVARK